MVGYTTTVTDMTPAKQRRDAGTGGLYQDANGYWTAAVELPPGRDGRRRRKVIRSKSKSVAAQKLRETRKELDRAGDLPTSSPTLAQWLRLWLKQNVQPYRKPRTYETYEGYVETHIIPAIGHVRLDKLTADDVRRLHKSMDTSSTTKLHAHRYLSKALKDAEREGRVPRNVAALVDAPRKAVSSRGALTPADARKLLANSVDDPARFVRLCVEFLGGLRQSERLGLTREAVDLTTGTITVSWQLQRLRWSHGCEDDPTPKRGKVWACGRKRAGSCPQRRMSIPDGHEAVQAHGGLWLTRPKSRAGWRVIPMAAPLAEAMRRYLPTVDDHPLGLVFTQGGAPIGHPEDGRQWHAMVAEAGLPKVDQHSARHTCNSLLADLGVPAHVRIRILGHAAESSNEPYTHATDQAARDAVALLGDLLLPAKGEQGSEPGAVLGVVEGDDLAVEVNDHTDGFR